MTELDARRIDVTILSGRRTASTLDQRPLHIKLLDNPRESSPRCQASKSLSNPPVVISAAVSGVKNGSGLRPRARA
jgi:hypothetical protein